MTNKNITKKALFMSVFSVLLCFSMLVGTTFAWFTDSVTSENNIIKAGNLDVDLEYWNGTDWVDVEGASDVLTNELWEPGVVEVAYLRLSNAGSLALKYKLGINIAEEYEGVNKAGDKFLLSDYILFGVTEITADADKNPVTYANREAAVADVDEAEIISAGYLQPGVLYPENNIPATVEDATSEIYLALVVWMPTSIENEANHDGTNIPEINLGIDVVATQLAYEEDSYGNGYDDGLEMPDSKDGLKIEVGDVIVNVPADAFASGATRPVVSEPAIEPIVPENATDKLKYSISFDIKIDGLKEGNTEPCKVTCAIPADILADITAVEVYHNGELIANPVFDKDAGTVVFYTTSFSPFKIVLATDYVVIPEAYTNDEAVAMLKNAASKGGKIDGNGRTIDLGSATNNGALNITNKEVSLANMTLKGKGTGVQTVVMVSGKNQTVKMTNVTVQNTSSGVSLTLSLNGATSQIFKNCTFMGKAYFQGSNATFINCSFNKNNNMDTSATNFTFKGCKFTASFTDAITLNGTAKNILVEDCTFTYSAFRIYKTMTTQPENVKLINNTYKATKLVRPDNEVASNYEEWKANGVWIEEGNVKA